MNRSLLIALTSTLAAGAVAVPAAQAQTTTPTTTTPSPSSSAGTIHINNCTVSKSRNAGGFAWASCAIVTQGPAQAMTVRYRSNLPTYVPLRNSDYGPQSKTVSFDGGGEIQSIKLAFKKLTVAQVVSKLKVTLSQPTGATITDGTATAVAKTAR
ncbi:MAG TPA: hypothetical protein VGM33_26725 [Baekduia sp.]|jgi:hypothetical protein